MPRDDLFDEQMTYPFPTDRPEVVAVESSSTGGKDVRDSERRFPGCGGVYLLTDEADRVILLSSAADMRRALGHRLLEATAELAEPTEGSDSGHPRRSRLRLNLHEIVRRIRWKRADSPFELNYEYLRIARELIPKEYLANLAFGPAWFIHADPASAIPRFSVGTWLIDPCSHDLGPFPTQAAANRFVQVLQDIFDLCRYEYILEKTPHGQACAYFEMGKCPAPCDGSLPMALYREMVRAAWAFASGQRAEQLSDWQARMASAATRQEYEYAGHFKQILLRAREMVQESYRYVRPVKDFNYLVVQRVGGRRRVKPFFIRKGWITPGEAVALKDLDRATAEWSAAIAGPLAVAADAVDESSLRLRSEHIWLVSHYLFKRESPGWFIHQSDLTAPESLAAEIRARLRNEHDPGSYKTD
ncbi:MAG: hypothetical protein GXY44_00260 [Phycisphaerales bacterium]|nr:hypothetical protein [Phycisphaerales bacterium]